MKYIGTISYNIYCNFTNYGSALQTWASNQVIEKLGYHSKLIDYCPNILADKNPLNPFANMWNKDEESRKMCELTLPAIRKNYIKFNRFYNERFDKTKKKYTATNFNEVVNEVDGFICGSDTIFCIDEFGFDDGYYANYICMKEGYSIAYAASFGDAHFTPDTYMILNERLQNFKAIGLRESGMVPYVQENTSVPVQQVVDPTLLLTVEDYDKIATPKLENDKYLLLYTRRHNPKMEAFAEKIAAVNGWRIIEISLRAINAERHQMFYEAGVEEFLSLVKHAEFIVTNSFHGMIFSVQYERPFYVFSREQCEKKIVELLDIFGLSDRLIITGEEKGTNKIDYVDVHSRINHARNRSIQFLANGLSGCK